MRGSLCEAFRRIFIPQGFQGNIPNPVSGARVLPRIFRHKGQGLNDNTRLVETR